MKNVMILTVFLVMFPQYVDAQKLFVPLLGGGFVEMGGAPTPVPIMTPMAPLQPIHDGFYNGNPSGPIMPMQPMQPLMPVSPMNGGGFGVWQ